MEKAKAWANESIGNRPKYLAAGAELETFSAFAERRTDWLSNKEHEFVDASNKAREAEEKRKADDAARLKRQVFLSLMFAVAAGIALVVVGFVGWNLHRANTNLEQSTKNLEQSTKKAQANLTTARQNLSSALTALASAEWEHRPVDAAKYALAAWPRGAAMDIPKREATLDALSRSLAGLHDERMRITTKAPITSVAFSPDGVRVLTGSYDNTARLWDAATGKEIRAFKGHVGSVTSVAFSPDGARVLTGSGDATARLWAAATGEELRAFKGHDLPVSSVAF
ncbi:MAG TPA: hypothetical protein VN890_02260, partial [Methylocella sp.]|nr:hypothetical protein [Methylocella sp.]